jgi:hypothetical protein
MSRAGSDAPTRLRATAALLLLAAAVGGCGSSSGSAVKLPPAPAARVFSLGGFIPQGPVPPHRPVQIAFTVRMPDGKPLTRYRVGSGPHTGVHLILVRRDLAYIIHEHPPVEAGGLLRQTVTFPAPGDYRVLVDLYPNIPGGQPNFQLYTTVHVSGAYRPRPLPGFHPVQTIDGYRFAVVPPVRPRLHAIQAQFLHIDVTDPAGRPVRFVPWFGALAHAIFFRQGSLDYFHTHICAPSAANCGTLPGVAASRVTGQSAAPGKLTVGVLLPVPGTWRLFLQLRQGSRVLTAPYTLKVS